MGLGIDELLISYGREHVFRYTLGKGLDKALNSLGLENPNKYITRSDFDMKALKYRYNKLNGLNNDINELDSISNEAGAKDSEFIQEIKKDLKKRIEYEKTLYLYLKVKYYPN